MNDTADATAPGAAAFRAPPIWKRLLEARAFGEYAALWAARPFTRTLPRGDGHGVIVLPGFTAGDRSTEPLRRTLRSLGYHTFGWRLGPNLGPTAAIVDGIVDLLGRAYDKTGAAVSIVGWSLGGIYARELARSYPRAVRQVITLGSPIQMIQADDSAAGPLFDSLRRLHTSETYRTVRDCERPPLSVPATSIYTRLDGVVSWRSCLIEHTDNSDNIEVLGSHSGLGFNPSVIYAIADRLALPADDWRPFTPPLRLRAMYPRPHHLDVASIGARTQP